MTSGNTKQVIVITEPWSAGQGKRTNRFAAAALVCGIAQFGYLFGYKPLGFLAIVAIILGHVAMRQMRRTGEQGRNLARAGLILGYLVLVVGFLVPLLFLLTW